LGYPTDGLSGLNPLGVKGDETTRTDSIFQGKPLAVDDVNVEENDPDDELDESGALLKTTLEPSKFLPPIRGQHVKKSPPTRRQPEFKKK